MAAALRKWVRHPIDRHGRPSLIEGVETSCVRAHPIVANQVVYRDSKVGEFTILVRGARYYFFHGAEFVTALDYSTTWDTKEPYQWHVYLEVDIDEEPKEMSKGQKIFRIIVAVLLGYLYLAAIIALPILIVVVRPVVELLTHWVSGTEFGVLHMKDIPSLTPQCNPSR